VIYAILKDSSQTCLLSLRVSLLLPHPGSPLPRCTGHGCAYFENGVAFTTVPTRDGLVQYGSLGELRDLDGREISIFARAGYRSVRHCRENLVGPSRGLLNFFILVKFFFAQSEFEKSYRIRGVQRRQRDLLWHALAEYYRSAHSSSTPSPPARLKTGVIPPEDFLAINLRHQGNASIAGATTLICQV